MKMKSIGIAVAVALLGLSGASFAAGEAAGSGGQSTAAPGKNVSEPAATRSGLGHPNETPGTSGSVVTGGASTGATAATRCDDLTGKARTRCLRDERASRGSSMSTQDQHPARESHATPGNAVQGPAAGSGSTK